MSIHKTVSSIKPTVSHLPVFHTFTGCDTVSAFAGREKMTAWITWKSFPEVTVAFSELLCMPSRGGSRILGWGVLYCAT